MISCSRKRPIFALLAVAIVACMPVAATSQGFDDPVFAICEFSRFGWDGPQKRGMVRTDAKINGQTVVLSYEQSVLNMRPRQRKVVCEYALINGAFELRVPRSADADSCEAALAELSRSGLEIDQRIKLEKAAAPCRDVIEAEKRQNEILANSLRDLAREGVYPIQPADTEMVSPE